MKINGTKLLQKAITLHHQSSRSFPVTESTQNLLPVQSSNDVNEVTQGVVVIAGKLHQ